MRRREKAREEQAARAAKAALPRVESDPLTCPHCGKPISRDASALNAEKAESVPNGDIRPSSRKNPRGSRSGF